MAPRIVEPVALLAKTLFLQLGQGQRRRIGLGFQLLVEPHRIARRNRTHASDGQALHCDLREILPPNRLRDRAPESRRTKPSQLIRRNRRFGHLVEPQLLALERHARIAHRLRHLRGQGLINIGVHFVDQVDLAALKSQYFQIPIGRDIHPNLIHPRQRMPLRIVRPVIRIPAQKHILACFVLGDMERPQHRFLMQR